MTELLKDMMNERADSLGAPDLDVLAMVREGNRRAARRRTTVVALGAAAAVVAAFALPSLLADSPDKGRDVQPTSAFATPQPSYATGSTVHVGTASYDVGRSVSALFVTTEGIVFADDAGTVLATDGAGTPTEIGSADLGHGSLVGDGSRAGWVEHQAGRAPVFTVHDLATGETVVAEYDTAGEGPTEYHPSFFAIDGTDAYFRDARGVIRWDLESGEQEWIGSPLGAELHDVKAGVIAHSLPRDPDNPVDVEEFAGTDFGSGGPLDLGQASTLNPSGTLLLGSGIDEAVVADTKDGSITPLTAPGYVELQPYAWLDDDSFAATAATQADPRRHDVLACDVGGGCSVVSTSLPASVTYAVGYRGSVG